MPLNNLNWMHGTHPLNMMTKKIHYKKREDFSSRFFCLQSCFDMIYFYLERQGALSKGVRTFFTKNTLFMGIAISSQSWLEDDEINLTDEYIMLFSW